MSYSRRSSGARALVRVLARRAPEAIGSTASLAALTLLTLLWLAAGPFVSFSDAWLLVPSAGASIVALLLVVLLQYSQNRDTRALQLKLDELISSLDAARSELVGLERRSEEELKEIEDDFERLRAAQSG
jgi:low affinity Fe/Cu permease